jgi:hypothetical protein
MTKTMYPVPSSTLDDDASSNNFWNDVDKARNHKKYLDEGRMRVNMSSDDLSTISGSIPLTRLGQTTSDGSVLPSAPPVLQRSPNLQTMYPGAVPVTPVSRALVNSDGDGDSLSLQYDTNLRERNAEADDSFLVNAELVVSTNEEELDAEAQRQYDPSSLPLARSTRGPVMLPPIFAAKAVDEKSPQQPNEPGFKDFFRNRMVKLVGMFLCLIISGLVVGVVIGFGFNGTIALNSTNSTDLAAAMPSATPAPVYADMQPTIAAPTPSPSSNIFQNEIETPNAPTPSVASSENDDDDDQDEDQYIFPNGSG